MITKLTNNLVDYPLYGKEYEPLIKLEKSQIKAIETYNKKIKTGEYVYEKVSCLCEKNNKTLDLVILHKDRYGIPMNHILCKNCGLIRIDFILEEKNLFHFYEYLYRPIYNPSKATPANYFKNQKAQGRKFLSIFKKHSGKRKIGKIVEIGCGAGGILAPFKEISDELIGCDFDDEFLQYGVNQNLDLRKGTLEDLSIPNQSTDLIILSHVLEHFKYPLKELKKLNEKIRVGGYLIIEVPGTGSIHKGIFPRFFQNVHLYIFHQKFLENILHQLGYKTLYGNENVTLLFQKIKHVANDITINISDHPKKAQEIQNYLKFAYLYYHSFFNIYKLKRFYIHNVKINILKLMDLLKIREPLRKLVKGY